MNETEFAEDSGNRSRRRSRKLLWIILASFLLIPAVPLALRLYHSWSAARNLEATLAEIDNLDPGWRLEDLDASRQAIAHRENGARQVLAASELLPAKWFHTPFYYELENFEPPQLLDDRLAADVRAVLDKHRPAVRIARSLARSPRGSYPIRWTEDALSTLIPHLDNVRSVNRLLVWDAMLRAHDNDLNEAWASSQAALNTARSIGDEPIMISQLVRLACGQVAVQSMERVLAHGKVSEHALARMQQLLEDEAREPFFLRVARAERATLHRVFTCLEEGKITIDQLPGPPSPKTVAEQISDFFTGRTGKRAHVRTLNYLTEAVQITKLPPEDQEARFQKLEVTVDSAPSLARQLLPAFNKMRGAHKRCLAQLRSAFTAIAVERYRVVHGQWPKGLGGLVPVQLQRVPSDPFDGKPLRFRRLKNSIVIYSIGPDGKDNGGTIDRKLPLAPGTDLGFQLWDPSKRRQLAEPAK
jgi:hypothetical protein